jgi:hypothetical protein
MKIIFSFLAFAVGFNLNAQQINLDSLISTKNTISIEGIIPVCVTPGYEIKARLWQSVIAEAKQYYESKYKNIEVNAKLAVLDSAHWTSEVVSYGYTFASQGWIVLPGDVDFNDFVRIYGDISLKDEFLQEAKTNGIKPDEIEESVFSDVCVHELGHLIMNQMIKDGFTDILFNELAANIVAYEFFKKNKPELLRGFELFCNFHLNNYRPSYTTLNELYDNMGKMSVANYDWYESKFMKLVEVIYNYKQVDFLTSLKNICRESRDKNLGIKEIAVLLDKDYQGLITTWLSKNNW